MGSFVILQSMRDIQAADLCDWTIEMAFQQGYRLVAEIGVAEQQAAHVGSPFMIDVEEASGGRLSVRNDDRPENTDFAANVNMGLPA